MHTTLCRLSSTLIVLSVLSLPVYGQAQTWVTVEKGFDLQRWEFSISQRVQTSWYRRTLTEKDVNEIDEIDFIDDVFFNREYDDPDDLSDDDREEDEHADPGSAFEQPEPETRRQLTRGALRGRTELAVERRLGRRWDGSFEITYNMRPGTDVGGFRTGIERTFRRRSLRVRAGAFYQGQVGLGQTADYRSATRLRVYATRRGSIGPFLQSEAIQRFDEGTLRADRLRFQTGLRLRISRVHRLTFGYRMQYRITRSDWSRQFRVGYTIRF